MENNSELNNKEEKKEDKPLVHTFAQDLVQVAESGTPGSIKDIIDAEENKEIEELNLSPKSSKNQMYLIFGFLLLALGGLVVYYFTSFLMQKDYPVNQNITEREFLSMDKNKQIEIADLYKTEIYKKVFSESDQFYLNQGEMARFEITENNSIVKLPRLVDLIESSLTLPADTPIGSNFIFGAFKNEKNEQFFILQTKSTNEAFPTLRSWENKMFFDLALFFGIETNQENKYLLTKNFEDGIVENKNARVLLDEFGSTVFMYVFVSDNIVVFTKDGSVVEEIIDRLAQANLRK